MKPIRQLFVGLLSAIATSLIVLGAGALAFMEGDVNVAPLPALETKIPLITQTTAPGEPTPTRVTPATPTATWVKFIQCNVPHGWKPYEVRPGDTLETIAERFSLTAEMIYQKNCLQSTSLPPGTILYLPAPTPTVTMTPLRLTPTVTPTPTVTLKPEIGTTPCGPPPGWVVYVVRSGDTLYRLSVVLGTSQNALLEANCLTSPYLYVGQRLYVPFIPPSPPTRTPTPTDIPTVKPSDTPVTLTPDLTATEAANQTATAEAEATNAANQTATAEAEATNAANQTATAEAANQTATAEAANQTATAEAANQTATAAANQTATAEAANQAATATSAAQTATAEAGGTP